MTQPKSPYLDTTYRCESCGFEISNQQPMTMQAKQDAFVMQARPCLRCYTKFFCEMPQMTLVRGIEPDPYFQRKTKPGQSK